MIRIYRVSHNPLFTIIGPPAVGKSTISRAIAAHFPKSIHIPVDNLRDSGDSPARAYIDEGIRIIYQQLYSAVPQLQRDGYLIVDTTKQSIEETVATILQLSGVEILPG